jgi:hypothetical protein
VVKKYLEVIEDAAKTNPTTKFFLVDPILRPKLSWYDAILDTVKKELKDMLQKIGLNNVSSADVISRASQQFDPDQIHLTDASGKVFVQGILEAAEKSFHAEFIELGDGEASDPPRPQVSLH